jgi:hypothetical protein
MEKIREPSGYPPDADAVARAGLPYALTGLASSGRGADLARRIGDIAGAADLLYEPIWRPYQSYMCGYLATRPAGPDRARTENLSWEDLVLLGAAARSLKRLMDAGGRSVLLLPLCAGTLDAGQIGDLYCFCFQALSPAVRRHIVLELGNMPVHGLSKPVEDRIRSLADQCRSVVINTASPLRKYDPSQFLNAQAYGFNLSSALCEGTDPAVLCSRFRAQYHSNCRLYITGVNSAEALHAAMENGFSYISGLAVAPGRGRMGASRSLRARDLAVNAEPILETA